MYLSTLRLWNFRKYCAMADGKPGLEIHLWGTERNVY